MARSTKAKKTKQDSEIVENEAGSEVQNTNGIKDVTQKKRGKDDTKTEDGKHVSEEENEVGSEREALTEEELENTQNGEKSTEENETAEETEVVAKKGGKKRGKQTGGNPKKKSKPKEEESNYEVEKVINVREKKGKQEFLIRWKGYSSKSDTWEPEEHLDCENLIKEFLDKKEVDGEKTNKRGKKKTETEDTKEEVKDFEVDSEKTNKRGKKKTETEDTKEEVKDYEVDSEKTNKRRKKKTETEDTKEEVKDYEVEKIIEVKTKRDGKQEFLIRWKGYSAKDDTWEPEDNLECENLIKEFLESQKVAKSESPKMAKKGAAKKKENATEEPAVQSKRGRSLKAKK